MKEKLGLLISIVLLFCCYTFSNSSQSFFYKEINCVAGYSNNSEYIFNLNNQKNSVGLEYFRKVSSLRGDFLTLNFQARIIHDEYKQSKESFLLEIHNAWLEYKLSSYTRLKLGHFSPFFGLEPLIDTHGTLMQTLAFNNLGFKKDWGMGLKKILANFDLNIGMQLGRGKDLTYKDNNLLLTSRLSSNSYSSFNYGLSVLYSQIDNLVKRRIGIDSKLDYGNCTIMNELFYGSNDDQDVFGYLVQTDTFISDNKKLKIQLKSWINDYIISLGLENKLSNSSTIRLHYKYDIYRENVKEDRIIALQYYYFGL